MIENAVVDGELVVVRARASADRAACPACGTTSGRVHSRYVRRLADTAVAGRPVMIELQVRRFRCRNRGEPVALRGARRVRREVRGNGPGEIPAPRPGLTQRMAVYDRDVASGSLERPALVPREPDVSLQPHSGAEIPPLTARVARAANPDRAL
ncbi:transposase family protein [Streptomyces sp. NPDC101225]|uniref:transposase family protein n=1 Tax=Streptomyces sp. NPDC101225 TaxID=3366135 RepID=UPI00381A4FF8